jgi:hypothetical protein
MQNNFFLPGHGYGFLQKLAKPLGSLDVSKHISLNLDTNDHGHRFPPPHSFHSVTTKVYDDTHPPQRNNLRLRKA